MPQSLASVMQQSRRSLLLVEMLTAWPSAWISSPGDGLGRHVKYDDTHQSIYLGIVQAHALCQETFGDLLACHADDVQNVYANGVIVAWYRAQDALAAVCCLPVLGEPGALQVLSQSNQGRQRLLILQRRACFEYISTFLMLLHCPWACNKVPCSDWFRHACPPSETCWYSLHNKQTQVHREYAAVALARDDCSL